MSEILPAESFEQGVGRDIPDFRKTGREGVGTVMDSFRLSRWWNARLRRKSTLDIHAHHSNDHLIHDKVFQGFSQGCTRTLSDIHTNTLKCRPLLPFKQACILASATARTPPAPSVLHTRFHRQRSLLLVCIRLRCLFSVGPKADSHPVAQL